MLQRLPIALFQAKINITSEYSQLNCLLLFRPKERTKIVFDNIIISLQIWNEINEILKDLEYNVTS